MIEVRLQTILDDTRFANQKYLWFYKFHFSVNLPETGTGNTTKPLEINILRSIRLFMNAGKTKIRRQTSLTSLIIGRLSRIVHHFVWVSFPLNVTSLFPVRGASHTHRLARKLLF